MATAGSIVLDLLMRTGSFETDSKRAEARLRAFEKEAKRVGKVIGTAIATGATVAVTALAAMTKQAIDTADSMRDMSIRLGIDIELLSAYGYAASQTGTDLEVIGKGLKVLAKNAADATNPTNEYAKVFEALGINVLDAEGKLRSLEQLVPEIADKFSQLEDGTTKAALAQSLFGRAGLEMTEFLNQGADGITELTDRARELGVVVDAETGAAADDFNDTLGDLKAISQGYSLHLAKELLPDLKQLADEFSNTATEGNKVKEMASDTADFLRGLATVAHFVSSAFELVGTSIATLHAQGQALGVFLFEDMGRGIRMYQAASQGLNDELDEAFGTGPKPPSKDPRFAGVTGGARTVSVADGDMMRRVADALGNPTVPKGESPEKAAREAERLRDKILGAGDDITKMLMRREDATLDVTRAEVAHDKEVRQLIEDEKFRLSIMGLSNVEQQKAITLRWAGVEATSAYGEELSELIERMAEEDAAVRSQIDAMDGLRDSARGLFADLRAGVDPIDALTDALMRFLDRLADVAMDTALDALFGKQGDTGGGVWGDAIGSFFAGLFGGTGGGNEMVEPGGGRASGGPVSRGKFYEVTEGGRPELFQQNGRTFLIPGSNGMVVPATHGLAAPTGGGFAGVHRVVVENKGQPMQSTGARMETGPNGERQLRVFVDSVVQEGFARGRYDPHMERRYGTPNRGIR